MGKVIQGGMFTLGKGMLSMIFSLFIFLGVTTAQTVSGGLCGEYQNYIAPPDYQPSEIVMERLDPTINFNRGGGGPGSPVNNNQFFIKRTGAISPPTSGNYTFRTWTDDGIRVYLNNSLIINNRTNHAPTYNYSSTISLTAGTEYDLVIEFYENGGGAVMQFAWDTPTSSGYEVLPSTSLYALDSDGDGVVDCEDCNAKDGDIYAGNTELCDGKDNDCDGTVDEGCNRYCDDDDNDGYIASTPLYSDGSNSGFEKLCSSLANTYGGGCTGGVIGAGYISPTCATECTPSDGRSQNNADSDAQTYPGAPELCDIDLAGSSGYLFEHAWDQDCVPGSFNGYDETDVDSDTIPACADNCPDIANPDQADSNGFEDGDGKGDICEIVCGNGVINDGEECDDGNAISGDGCSGSNAGIYACQNEYCRDDAPLQDTTKNFVVTDLTPTAISGTSTQQNSQVAICFEDANGSRDVFYTTTDATGSFSYTPNFTPYIAPRINIGVMLHDQNGNDIDHHALTIVR